MSDEEVIRKFLVEIGYKTDAVGQQKALSDIEVVSSSLKKLAAVIASAYAVDKIIRFNDNLAKTAAIAARMGTTVQGLERLGKASEIAGGSVAGLKSAMESFASFVKTQPGSAVWLEKFLPGITRDKATGFLKDATGRTLDQLEALKKFVDALAHSGMDLAIQLQYAKQAGISENEYLALTNKSVQELEASLKKLDDTFLVLLCHKSCRWIFR